MVNAVEDIWKKIITGDIKECWPWQGGKNKRGYGTIKIRQQPLLVHRIAWEITFGKITEGKMVMHRCNNPSCCNPAHLKLGTDVNNQRHRSASGSYKKAIKCTGVYFNKKGRCWEARVNTETLYRGKDFFEACCVRKSWEAQELKRVNAI